MPHSMTLPHRGGRKNELFFDTTEYFDKQGCLSIFLPKWSGRNLNFDLVEIRYDDIFTLCSK